MLHADLRDYGFDGVLAMSDPLALILSEGKPGNEDTIRRSITAFKWQFE